MPKLSEYLQIKEAAEYLGVCEKTLRNWEAGGKLRVFRNPLNRYRLYKVSDLDDLLRKIEGTKQVATTRQRATRRRKPR